MTSPLSRLILFLGLVMWIAPGPAHAVDDKVAYLSEKLTDTTSFKVRLKAAVLLGRMNDQRAVRPLTHALRDDNHVVRGAAARALGNLGHPMAVEAVEPLFRLLDDEAPFVRKEAQRALLRLAGEESVDYFISALSHRQAAVRLAAVHVLAKLDLPEARSALALALGDEDEEVSAEAIVAVRGLQPGEMEQLLKSALAGTDNYRSQAAVVRLVGELKMVSLLGPVADLLVSDAVVPEVKEEAATTLRGMKDALDVPGLIGQLGSEDRTIKGRAIALLGLQGGREAVDALLGLLRDPDVYVRHKAVFALGDADDPRAVPALEYLQKTETDKRLIQLVERVLRKLKP